MARLTKNRIPQTRAAITAAAARGVARAGGYVLDLAQQLAPKDEGDLAASGRLEPNEPALRVNVLFGGVRGPNKFVDYAHFVEYGTVYSEAQPFLTPAARAVSVRREVAAEIKKVLR